MLLSNRVILAHADLIRPYVQYTITNTRELTIDQLRDAFKIAHRDQPTKIRLLGSDRSLEMVLDEICAC